MKAWIVQLKTEVYDEQYILLLHADTREKARYLAKICDPGLDFQDADWTDIQAIRFKKMDDKPFTIENLHVLGWWLDEDWYINECKCELCEIKN
jgi:hypothetical protein